MVLCGYCGAPTRLHNDLYDRIYYHCPECYRLTSTNKEDEGEKEE